QAQAIATYYQKKREELVEAVKESQPLPGQTGLYPVDKCWSCSKVFDAGEHHCPHCGVPLQTPAVYSMRWLVFVRHEIKVHEKNGRLTLAQAHACLTEVRELVATLRSRAENERIVPTRPTARPSATRTVRGSDSPSAGEPRRSMLEIFLDPRSIQWLLAFGGA